MIEGLDEVLRQLLICELPIENNVVDIAFNQPKRDWAARIGQQPTLNLFLYDLRENNALRQTQPMWDVTRNDDGTTTRLRKPVRMDLHYMITAWATEPEDEHKLLTGALMALLRYPNLSEQDKKGNWYYTFISKEEDKENRLLPASLQGQPAPISAMIAQQEELRNPADIWSALDNEVRPAIVCIVTLAINPYQPVTINDIVQTRETRFGQSPDPSSQKMDTRGKDTPFWTVGGTIHSDQKLEPKDVRITLVERGLEIPLRKDGRFTIESIRAGDYTLKIEAKRSKPQRRKITVPSPDYEFKI